MSGLLGIYLHSYNLTVHSYNLTSKVVAMEVSILLGMLASVLFFFFLLFFFLVINGNITLK